MDKKSKKIEDIKVSVIDTEELIKIFGIRLKENQILNIRKYCIYQDIFMIDTDAMFSEIYKVHHNDVIQKCLSFSCSIDEKTDTGRKMGVIRFEKIISLTQFLLLANEVKLVDFIRYNYNPRIIGNQNLLMEWINSNLDQ